MSPEQLNLGAIDHRADVWAVGIMLFELVAGAHPVLDAPVPQLAQAEIAAFTLDDPRLWAATSYCMPIERRIKLLGVSRDQAQSDRQRCLDRVERARVSDRP